MDGESLVELETLEAGEALENFEELLEVGPVLGRYMGNAEVYKVTLEERRRPQHATVVQRQELQDRCLSAEQGPLDEIHSAGRVEIRYGECLQQGGGLSLEEDGQTS